MARTFRRGDKVHIQHPSGAEWDGVFEELGATRMTAWLSTGELVPISWISPLTPKPEPQVGDIGDFSDGEKGGFYRSELRGIHNNEGFPYEGFPYEDEEGDRWESFRPIARKLRAWEELTKNDQNSVGIDIVNCTSDRGMYESILRFALPGYPEITHARIGKED